MIYQPNSRNVCCLVKQKQVIFQPETYEGKASIREL